MKPALKISLITGGLHLAAFLAFAGLMASNTLSSFGADAAQWQLGWMVFVLIDLPVSLLMAWDGWPDGEISWLPYPLSDFRSFLVPIIVFGIFGTLWYAFLGGLAGYIIGHFTRFAESRKKPPTT